MARVGRPGRAPDVAFEDLELPEGFLFGISNSGYQAEGGFNGEGEPKNNWFYWERSGGREISGASVRFWERPEEHIELAASLGLNAFRMGIEWARLQPTYETRPASPPAWDIDALDRYAEIIVKVIAAGMEPIITLHHFIVPAWCGQDFWLSQGMACLFVDYASRVVEEVNLRVAEKAGRPVDFWITMNEPNLLPLIMYVSGEHPHGKSGIGNAAIAHDNMMLAHTHLYDRIHGTHERHGWGEPMVTFNSFSTAVYELDRVFYDLMRARSLGIDRAGLDGFFADRRSVWDAAFDTLASWRWPDNPMRIALFKGYRKLVKALSGPLRLKNAIDAIYASERPRKIDCIALDIYDPFVLGTVNLNINARSLRGPDELLHNPWWEWTHEPEQFRAVIMAHNEHNLDNLPIYVMENCIGHHQEKEGPAEPRPDGQSRDEYLRWSIGETLRAASKGIPMKGYVYWTLVDNYEWGSFRTRLGLYDYDHAACKIKDRSGLGEAAGETYKGIVSAVRGGKPEAIKRALGL